MLRAGDSDARNLAVSSARVPCCPCPEEISMLIGVPAETTAGETRVAVTPETVKKLVTAGHTIRVQSGAGVAASVTDAAYIAAGAEITDVAGAFGADMVLKVRSPNDAEAALMKPGTVVI